jgi:hypothetical protein
MKKTIVVLSSIILVGISFVGCQKKGPNDPAISMHGRRGRVDGEWKVSKCSKTTLEGNQTFDQTFDGTTWTYTAPGSSKPTTSTGEWKIIFDKKGTYSADDKRTSTTTSTFGSITITTTTVGQKISSGKWNFMGGVGDKKNRSQLITFDESVTNTTTTTKTGQQPSTSTSTSTFTGSQASSTIYDIDQLKNKEMILTWTGTSNGSPSSVTGSITLTQ